MQYKRILPLIGMNGFSPFCISIGRIVVAIDGAAVSRVQTTLALFVEGLLIFIPARAPSVLAVGTFVQDVVEIEMVDAVPTLMIGASAINGADALHKTGSSTTRNGTLLFMF